ncbi:transposase [Arcicella sp. LKC2W]|uniref:transposase n=1 Tax=Arcicella sp. LKC2W TaxID=2984198 RepID=UPI002B21E3C6|nr:transposase [Arcicella sp. LKC2W]MEA5459962.1 transposase [Arcicella sp. LKC2W]
MNEKYKNLYRIPSARLQNWDYTADGAYFITICTKNRIHFFGECEKGKMKLSTIGAIVQGLWYDIPNHPPYSVILGDFVVMPNHIHGIIVIDKSTVETLPATSKTENEQIIDIQPEPETLQVTSLPLKNEFYKQIAPKAGSIARIVGAFKSSCSRHINAGFPDINFAWQERFWDNIIRTEESYDNISDYIINNPFNWDKDKFFD